MALGSWFLALPLCSFVSSVVKGFDQRKSAAKSFG